MTSISDFQMMSAEVTTRPGGGGGAGGEWEGGAAANPMLANAEQQRSGALRRAPPLGRAQLRWQRPGAPCRVSDMAPMPATPCSVCHALGAAPHRG